MPEWRNKVFSLKDISRLYVEKAGNWLLLEILETNSKNEPKKLMLIAASPDKDALHDYILQDENWDSNKNCLLVLADPNKPCSIE